MPVPGWVSITRIKVENRIKRKDIPILCEGHAKELSKGALALVDHSRCEKCFPVHLRLLPPPKNSA